MKAGREGICYSTVIVVITYYIGFGLRFRGGTQRIIIADVFNIIQKVRDTGIHLEVDFIESRKLRIAGVHCRESAGSGPVVLKVVPVTGAAFADHHFYFLFFISSHL